MEGLIPGGGLGITGLEFLSASLQAIAAVVIKIRFSLTGFKESLKTS